MIYETDELYHHGVKGQKWGVRRYQNEDGSRIKNLKTDLIKDRKMMEDVSNLMDEKYREGPSEATLRAEDKYYRARHARSLQETKERNEERALNSKIYKKRNALFDEGLALYDKEKRTEDFDTFFSKLLIGKEYDKLSKQEEKNRRFIQDDPKNVSRRNKIEAAYDKAKLDVYRTALHDISYADTPENIAVMEWWFG